MISLSAVNLVIRQIVHHQYFFAAPCAAVYFFEVEFLQVQASTTDVPLLKARPTGRRCWLSQKDIVVFSDAPFCLREHDDFQNFYLIELH